MNKLKINTCAIIGACVAFGSCGKSDEYKSEYYIPDNIVEYTLPSECDTISGKLMADNLQPSPTWLRRCDSLLVVLNPRANPCYFSVWNINNDSLIASFATKGNAKNEFVQIMSGFSFLKNSRNEILMQVPSLFFDRHVKIVNLTKSIEEGICVVESVERFKVNSDRESHFCNYYIVDESCQVFHQGVNFQDERDLDAYGTPYYIIRKNDEEKTINYYPKIISNPKDNRALVYGHSIGNSPDGTKYVETMGYIDILNILDINTGKVIGVRESSSYTFEDVENYQQDKDYPYRYFNHNTSLSDSYIFVLKDGNAPEVIYQHSELTYNNKRLAVFDYEGNFISTLIFAEDEIVDIAYDENSHILYGITEEARLYKYDLSKYLK